MCGRGRPAPPSALGGLWGRIVRRSAPVPLRAARAMPARHVAASGVTRPCATLSLAPQCSLGETVKAGRSVLKVQAAGKKCVLASLMADKIESSVLELMFEEVCLCMCP